MTAPRDVASLERAAVCIRAGDPVPEQDREEVAALLFGIARGRAVHQQKMADAKAPRLERDACIHALGQFFHAGSYAARAEHVRAALDRYLERTWQRTRTEERCPHPADTREAATWAVLQSKGGEALTPYRISIILRERDAADRDQISR